MARARARRARSASRARRVSPARTIKRPKAKTICVETIRALAEIEGVAGVHLMGHRNDDMLAEAIDRIGHSPRREHARA